MTISNLFIIGAGFTKAVFPAAPLNDDLLVQVVGTEPDNSPLGLIWSEYGLSNIETLLRGLISIWFAEIVVSATLNATP